MLEYWHADDLLQHASAVEVVLSAGRWREELDGEGRQVFSPPQISCFYSTEMSTRLECYRRGANGFSLHVSAVEVVVSAG